MEYGGAIETIGSITKMEHVCSLEKEILQGTLVLCNIDPFPGFRVKKSDDTIGQKTGSVFIILRDKYSPEKINRINKNLISSGITDKYPSYGEIITKDSILPCIRIKGLARYDQIVPVQNYFIQNGLLLMPYRQIESIARIKLFKTFRLIEIAEGLYRDLNEGAKIYIRIFYTINWKQFDEITKKIKFNMSNRNFDAALGVIYRFYGPENVIRIYDQEKTLERALHIKKSYLKEFKKAKYYPIHHDYLDD
jgi:hypothetical protein